MGKVRVNGQARKRNPGDTMRPRVGYAFASVALSFALGASPLFSGLAQAADGDSSTSSDASAAQTASEGDQSTDAANGYGFSGAYRGVLASEEGATDMEGETLTSSEMGQNVVLAQTGGWVSTLDGALAKSGDGAGGDDESLYGANAAVLAANAGSGVILSGTSIQADARNADGLFATDTATIWSNGEAITTAGEAARGLVATYGGTIVANALDIQTQGSQSPALAVGEGGGSISVTNSMMSVSDESSPILQSAGALEAENIMGRTAGSRLALLEGKNEVMLSHATLSSTASNNDDSSTEDGVVIYQEDALGTAGAATEETALFQAADSTLSSSVKGGSLFYLANTQAKVVLSDTSLEFDSSSSKLLKAVSGDDNNWGDSGNNGATATFTGIQQKFNGDIEVDSVSTVDFYLLSNSSWTGSAALTVRSGDTRTENLTVNIDATSSWTVTENSSVTSLNLATGGKLVDESGKSVRIVDADGLTLVDGASDVSITVSGDFSTSVKTSSANELEDSTISRDDFDATFDLETTFGTNGTGDAESEERVLEAVSFVRDWFHNLG